MKLRPRTGAEMDAWLALLRRHRGRLARRAGVVRVDFGYRWRGGRMRDEIALRVHVERKHHLASGDAARLPRTIGKAPVDVLEARIEAHASTEPLGGGLETGNVFRATAGTLGAIVFDQRTWAPMALSCHHVYVGERPNGGLGDPVTQPSAGTSAPHLYIGRIERSDARLDCAVAHLATERPVEARIKGLAEPHLGMRVTKTGCRTGITTGIVDGCDEVSFSIVAAPGERQRVLARRGDSGAVWIEAASHAAVGLHVEGVRSGRGFRYRATRMTAVAACLRIDPVRSGVLPVRLQAPALACFRGQMHLASSRGPRGPLEVRASRDGRQFGKPVRVIATLLETPSLTTFGERLVVAWAGVDGAIRIAFSKDGRRFSPPKQTPGRTDRGPSLCVHRERLHLAWREAGSGRLRVAISPDGITWTILRSPAARTAMGPGLASIDESLILAYVGIRTDALRVILSRDGASWRRTALRGARSASQPALVALSQGGILSWMGAEDSRVHLTQVGKPRRSVEVVLRDPGQGAPSLARLGSDLVCCWPDASRLRTLRFSCHNSADLALS